MTRGILDYHGFVREHVVPDGAKVGDIVWMPLMSRLAAPAQADEPLLVSDNTMLLAAVRFTLTRAGRWECAGCFACDPLWHPNRLREAAQAAGHAAALHVAGHLDRRWRTLLRQARKPRPRKKAAR